MAKRRNKNLAQQVIPLRLPEEMRNTIRNLSDKSPGLSDADIMRMAIAQGLGRLEELFAKPKAKAA